MNEYVARLKSERGFTLIELMLVIVILGILAGVVIFATSGIVDRGNVAACKTDLKTIEVAVEAYRAKNGAYPPNLEPTLVSTPDQFLRPDASLVADTKTGDGYTIDYQGSGTGEVWVDNSATGTC